MHALQLCQVRACGSWTKAERGIHKLQCPNNTAVYNTLHLMVATVANTVATDTFPYNLKHAAHHAREAMR